MTADIIDFSAYRASRRPLPQAQLRVLVMHYEMMQRRAFGLMQWCAVCLSAACFLASAAVLILWS